MTSPTARTQERVLVAGATGGVGQLPGFLTKR